MAAREVDMIYHLSRVRHRRHSGQCGAALLGRSWIERLYQHISALTHNSSRMLYIQALLIMLLQQQPILRRSWEGSRTCILHFFNPGAGVCLPSNGKLLLHVEAATSAEIHAPLDLVISFHLHPKIVQDGSDGTRRIVLWAVFGLQNTCGSVSYLETISVTVCSG